MSSTQNVLDAMTAGIMQKKADKGVVLTPVGAEKKGLPTTPATFPNDHPQEVVEQIIRDLELQVVRINEVCNALRLLTGKERVEIGWSDAAPKTVSVSATIKSDPVAEKKADENNEFKENFARLQQEAQDAVHKDIGESPFNDLPHERPETGWVCPQHGGVAIQSLTSRKGRKYNSCTKCEEFER